MDASARGGRTPLWAVPLFYLGLAMALTWPMALTFTTRLGGDRGDGFQNLWSFWWVNECLLHARNPFFTDHLWHPQGVSLVFQTLVLPDALVALPLWLVLPPLGVYNAMVLWSFTLCGVGMYALMVDWTGSHPATQCSEGAPWRQHRSAPGISCSSPRDGRWASLATL